MNDETALIYKVWHYHHMIYYVLYKGKDIFSSPYENECVGYCEENNIPYEYDQGE